MAATVSGLDRTTMGDHNAWYADLNLGTYATGGVPVSPYLFGLKFIKMLQVEPVNGYDLSYDRTNQKVIAFGSGGTQVTNATDLSGTTFRVLAIGRE